MPTKSIVTYHLSLLRKWLSGESLVLPVVMSGKFLKTPISLFIGEAVWDRSVRELAVGVIFSELSRISWLSKLLKVENCSLRGPKIALILSSFSSGEIRGYLRWSFWRHTFRMLSWYFLHSRTFLDVHFDYKFYHFWEFYCQRKSSCNCWSSKSVSWLGGQG